MLEQFFDAQRDPELARGEAAGLHAVNRLSSPEEVASLAVWLASDEGSFATGQSFVLDGGMTAGRLPRARRGSPRERDGDSTPAGDC